MLITWFPSLEFADGKIVLTYCFEHNAAGFLHETERCGNAC